MDFSLYIIFDGERPYVSTTEPSPQRRETARREGWAIFELNGAVSADRKLLIIDVPKKVDELISNRPIVLEPTP